MDHLRLRLAMAMAGQFDEAITLELLDPSGRSLILHDDAVQRTLTEKETEDLPMGPEPRCSPLKAQSASGARKSSTR